MAAVAPMQGAVPAVTAAVTTAGVDGGVAAPEFPWETLSSQEKEEVMGIVAKAQCRAGGPAAWEAAPQPTLQEDGRKASLVLPAVTLSFRGLEYAARLQDGTTKQILEPCSGSFESGQLVALMGPSGSGKTTLLDMLAMKKTSPYEGEVRVNGRARDPKTFRRIAAYVGQEDRMPAHWRVREAIEFNARLKQQQGARRSGSAAARELVDTLLEEFGLADVQDTYIGGPQVRGISGGQRRRVSLARGVAARAPILFCDEPTSGLSATDAELCVKALRAITRRLNVLGVVVIHQPRVEVVSLFDTLVLLTSSPGRITYYGPMAEARPYFQSLGFAVPEQGNPADVFMDLVTPGSTSDASGALVQAYKTLQAPGVESKAEAAFEAVGPTVAEMLQTMLQPEDGDARALCARSRGGVSMRAAPVSTQIGTVLARKVRLTYRNPLAGLLTVLMPCVMGTLLGSVFQGIHDRMFLQQVPFFFILVTGSCFQSMGFMAQLVDERIYMKYETSEALYNEWVMALANFCVDVPLALLGASFQIMIAYRFSGFPAELFDTIFGWTLLIFFVYDSLFSCVAAYAPDAQLAQLVATPMLTIFMLFNGFVVSKAGAPAWFRWIFEISPNFHTMQSMVTAVAEVEGADAGAIVSAFGYESGREGIALVVMVGSIIFYRVLQVIGLKFFNNVQR